LATKDAAGDPRDGIPLLPQFDQSSQLVFAERHLEALIGQHTPVVLLGRIFSFVDVLAARSQIAGRRELQRAASPSSEKMFCTVPLPQVRVPITTAR